MKNNQINCPDCGATIDVNEVLVNTLKKQIEDQYKLQIIQDKKDLQQRENNLSAELEKLNNQKEDFNKKLASELEKSLAVEKLKIQTNLRETIQRESETQLKSLQQELDIKSNQIKEFNSLKSEMAKVMREKDEMESKLKADSEIELNKKLNEAREEIAKQESVKHELRLKDKQKVIDDLNNQLKEATRKAEQGSMQLQGETQELAIEEYLAKQFPLDTIQEIKKGERGADSLHVVNTRTAQNCGSILYESKRTKNFSNTWIPKLKEDMQLKNADFGVLVTEVYPSDMTCLGQIDDIWVCSYEEFKGLCTVLRQTVTQLHSVRAKVANRGDKMGMIYDFLTSNEFKMHVESIVRGFQEMQTDLNSEKRSMQRIWKKREKQIDLVLKNTVQMYGSIEGIAGSDVEAIEILGLDHSDEDEDE